MKKRIIVKHVKKHKCNMHKSCTNKPSLDQLNMVAYSNCKLLDAIDFKEKFSSTLSLSLSRDAKPRICVISAGTKNIEYQWCQTNIIKQKYCDMHGYDYRFFLLDDDTNKESYYARQDLILKCMDDYDIVAWLDCDAWFCDFSKRIEDVICQCGDKAMTISLGDKSYKEIINRTNELLYHSVYINSGVIFFKAGDISKKIIELWKNPPLEGKAWMRKIQMKVHPNMILNDQPYICMRILWDDFVRQNTGLATPEMMNKYTKYQDKSMKNYFILHCAGKKDVDYIFSNEIKKWIDYTTNEASNH